MASSLILFIEDLNRHRLTKKQVPLSSRKAIITAQARKEEERESGFHLAVFPHRGNVKAEKMRKMVLGGVLEL